MGPQVHSPQQTLSRYYLVTLFSFYGIYLVWLSSVYDKWHWFSICPTDVKVSFKIWYLYWKTFTYHSAIPLLGIHPTETWTYIHQKTWEECSNNPVYNSPKLGIIQMPIHNKPWMLTQRNLYNKKKNEPRLQQCRWISQTKILSEGSQTRQNQPIWLEVRIIVTLME